MSLPKKIALGVLVALLASGGALFYFKGKDNYDPSKYEAKIVGGLEEGGIAPGTKVDLTLPDQFDVAQTVGPEVTTLILAFTKTTGGIVRGYLDEQEKDYLTEHRAVFIADISPFPVVLRNTVALPMLRKSPYSVLLLYEAEMADTLKSKTHAEEITIATLANGMVQAVRYISTEEELAAIFP